MVWRNGRYECWHCGSEAHDTETCARDLTAELKKTAARPRLFANCSVCLKPADGPAGMCWSHGYESEKSKAEALRMATVRWDEERDRIVAWLQSRRDLASERGELELLKALAAMIARGEHRR